MKFDFPGVLGREQGKIVYSVLETAHGWQIQALLPRRLSSDDRIKVLDWFHEYRKVVNREHPLWLTVFHGSETAYLLDIVRAETPQQLVAAALESDSEWRLDFDYAG